MCREIRYRPVEGLLNRDMAMAETKEARERYSPYLQEIVNYSTRLLVRCEKSLKGQEGTPASLIHLYYHAIQMADGIEALTSQACFAAVGPLGRSLLEAAFSIEFMVQGDFEQRSSAWTVESIRRHLAFLESMDPETDSGKAFCEKLTKDKIFGPVWKAEYDIEELREGINHEKQLLNRPKFAEIDRKLYRKGKLKKWFTISPKIGTFYDVAQAVNRPVEYETHYRLFSTSIHAQDVAGTMSMDGGIAIFTHIRPGSDSLIEPFVVAGSLLSLASIDIARKLRPDEPVKLELTEILKRHKTQWGNF